MVFARERAGQNHPRKCSECMGSQNLIKNSSKNTFFGLFMGFGTHSGFRFCGMILGFGVNSGFGFFNTILGFGVQDLGVAALF